jgi:crossover junction endodeoxyribonuclease RusA
VITRHWGFKLYGEPKPKGSMKCIGARGKVKHQLVESVDNEGWREIVTAGARRFVHEQADQHQSVYVEMTFSLSRPRSHYGTGRNAHRVANSAPLWPTLQGAGDSDKFARLVLDALQDAGVLRNDAQVRPLYVDKAYWDPHPVILRETLSADVLSRPGVVVRIRPGRERG